MAGGAAIFGVSAPPAIDHARSCGVSCEMVGASIARSTANASFSLCGPERSGLFALIAFELVCHPEQRAEDDGAIIAGQVHKSGLHDEAAEFDQMRVRLRRSTCHARMSCRAPAA